MPNAYSFDPIDIAGSQNDWRQSLAKTAQSEEQARQSRINTQLLRQQLLAGQQATQQRDQAFQQKQQDARRQQLQDLAFEQQVQEIPKNLPQWDKLSREADIALQTGHFKDAETLYLRGTQAYEREARVGAEKALKDKRDGEREEARVKLLNGFYSSAGGNRETWERAHTLYKAVTGQDSPYATVPWFEGVGDVAKGAVTKRTESNGAKRAAGKSALDDSLKAKRGKLLDLEADIKSARLEALAGKKAAGEKVGGKVASPSRGQVEETRGILKEYYPDVDQRSLEDHAGEIADAAKTLQASQGGEFRTNVAKVLKANPNMIQPKPMGMFRADKKVMVGVGTTERPHPNTTKEEYDKMKPGDPIWYDGKSSQKK